MEFIINNLIKIHPMALIHPDRIEDAGERREIRALTRGYDDPVEFFVETLALGIAKLAAPYHPHPVIVRLSDSMGNVCVEGGASADDSSPMSVSVAEAIEGVSCEPARLPPGRDNAHKK